LRFGAFAATFLADRSFTLQGQGWPPFKGTWTTDGNALELTTPSAPDGCNKPGRYQLSAEGPHVTFAVISDACVPRRMILDRSTWRPEGEPDARPERRIVRTELGRPAPVRAPAAAAGSWPSFRGPQAS
jgi:hypothetical protein